MSISNGKCNRCGETLQTSIMKCYKCGYEQNQITIGAIYKDVEPAIKLFEIMKDNVKFDGIMCHSSCLYYKHTFCKSFYRNIYHMERCQQCIDIFGGCE